jgi:phage-related protein
MGFIAKTFIFDGIPSESRNIFLGTINDSGESTTSGQDSSLLTQKLYRRPVPLYYGNEQVPVLSFPLSMYSPDEISAPDLSEISAWLFSQQNYKKLIICQNDMLGMYANCFLTAPNIIRIGNMIQSISTTVVCDSPWFWGEDATYLYTYPDSYTINDEIVIFNNSANSFYTYPTNLIITANVFGGNCIITNVSDNNRIFQLVLASSEIATLNCDSQTILSTTIDYPLTNLINTNWLRLLPGANLLTISGNISALSITFPVAIKVA